MKWLLPILSICVFLCGCTGKNRDLEQGMQLRSQLLSAAECSFRGKITADYGDEIYSFSMDCLSDEEGTVTFTVTAPETIAGIAGTVSQNGGKLMFTDTALQFSLMADGQLSPVATPWLLLKTLRSGYLTSACREGNLLHLTLNDSYEEDALQADIWLDAAKNPVRGEFLYDGKRILSLDVAGFQIR